MLGNLVPSSHSLTSEVATSSPIKSERARVSIPAVLYPCCLDTLVRLLAIFSFTSLNDLGKFRFDLCFTGSRLNSFWFICIELNS